MLFVFTYKPKQIFFILQKCVNNIRLYCFITESKLNEIIIRINKIEYCINDALLIFNRF